ncbi:MAG: type II secretion system major pseudopilin GspG [Mariprofundaceae bacterium]
MNTDNSIQARQRGFTLLEIMVVLVIIGVIAAIVAPSFVDQADEARIDATKIQMKNIAQTLKLYRLQNHQYPASGDGLKVLTAAGKNGKRYLDEMPMDGWGHEFIYLSPGVHGDFDLLSYGADGRPGGSGFDADIGSWEK